MGINRAKWIPKRGRTLFESTHYSREQPPNSPDPEPELKHEGGKAKQPLKKSAFKLVKRLKFSAARPPETSRLMQPC